MGTEEIRRLSQDEGMKDIEIGLMLGIHRTTVTRTRITYEIPRANLSNRKDKLMTCRKCTGRFIIRRKEKIYICKGCSEPEPITGVIPESVVYAY